MPIFKLLLAGLLCALHALASQALTLSPADPNLQYIGRWDVTAPTQPWAQAQGSTLVARFTGTSVAATLNVVSGEYFRVVIDGDGPSSTEVNFASGVSLPLAAGLSPGTHTLELIKETDEGRATLTALDIDDGASLQAPPARASRRIVFYGDSNLAGYSLESERNQGGSHLIGSYHGYAGITARMFGAEYQNVSRSGATIQSLNGAYERIDWNSSSPTWNFALEPADVVVVNIGANNSFTKNPNKTRYHNLLDDLRISHPDAYIVLYNAYGWASGEPADYTHEVVSERADPKLSSEVFPWVFEQFHGCQTDHAGMAVHLASHLAGVTGWAPAPADVVSGYGLGGDVANGSFEGVAPFGGWGWRYFDDAGVSRVVDPSGAKDGSHYLRLADGASSHQTNPASDGDVIDLSVWLRSANPGESVDVTISFRDQDGGGEVNAPLQSTTQNLVLTTVWQRYTMMATAPSGGGNPVFSARVAFQASGGSTVDIDAVAVGAATAVPSAAGANGLLLLTLATAACGSLWYRRDEGARRSWMNVGGDLTVRRKPEVDG